MIRKALLLRIFDAAYMQRWNDKVRPVELTELDKQAHKMVIAWFLGKFEEEKPGFDWIEIIEGGIFEFLQRLVVTDLKPPIFYRIKDDAATYRRLNDWVYGELAPIISPLGEDFCRRFRDYFATDAPETLNRRILSAAHFAATKWEFRIIERANPDGYEIPQIKQDLDEKQRKYQSLAGVKAIAENIRYRNFIDLCGQLRFQSRWAHLHRVPKTSVLGHSLFVAMFSYLFSLEVGACPRRLVNNYFTGLFHDMPEVLTRDIISPVKRSIEGLQDLVKKYEREQMRREVYSLLPTRWHPDMRLYAEEEFEDTAVVNGRRKRVKGEEIGLLYNENHFEARDGRLIKAVDDVAAFLEVYLAIQNGSGSHDLQRARYVIKRDYEKARIAGVNFGEIYADFD